MKAKEPRKKYQTLKWAHVTKAKIQLLEGDKVRYSLSITPKEAEKFTADIIRSKKNPLKVTFGVMQQSGNRIEFCAYKETLKKNPIYIDPEIKDISKPFLISTPKRWLVFLNGQHIALDIDDLRKLFRITLRMGNYFGLTGRKKAS